jgi:hypothetical protein
MPPSTRSRPPYVTASLMTRARRRVTLGTGAELTRVAVIFDAHGNLPCGCQKRRTPHATCCLDDRVAAVYDDRLADDVAGCG